MKAYNIISNLNEKFSESCSFFWGKFLQDEEVSETSGTDYRISRQIQVLKNIFLQKGLGKCLQDEEVRETSLCSAGQYGL